MSARVSIIMPAYRAAATIAEAVASVLAQSHADWELLLVADDGSDYERVLAGAGIADGRIRFLATEAPGRGPAAARNLGQRQAAGELVTRLDADDLYLPERLARLVPLALSHGIAGDNVEAHDGSRGGALGTVLPRSSGVVALAPLELMLSPVPWCLLFRRELLPSWDEALPFAEDVLFNASAFEHLERLPVLGEPLWRYRVMKGSLSHAPATGDRAEASYTRLLAECEAGVARFRKPELQAIWRRALEEKRELNRRFLAAERRGSAASFQEFALGLAPSSGR